MRQLIVSESICLGKETQMGHLEWKTIEEGCTCECNFHKV